MLPARTAAEADAEAEFAQAPSAAPGMRRRPADATEGVEG